MPHKEADNTSHPIKRKTSFTTKAIHLRTGKAKTPGPGKVNTLDRTEGKTPGGGGRACGAARIYIYIKRPLKKSLSQGASWEPHLRNVYLKEPKPYGCVP